MKLQNAMSSITIKFVYQLLFFIHVLTFVCAKSLIESMNRKIKIIVKNMAYSPV